LRSPRQAAAVGAYFILWPIFAPAILRRSLLVHETNIEQAIAMIRSSMEKIAFVGSPTISVFEFREVFARYTGLTLALNGGAAADPSTELLRIAGHRNIALASACMNRRNHERLSFHQMQARNEFVDLISAMVRAQLRSSELLELSLQLATMLNDGETAEDISVLVKSSYRLAAY
jgi:hypothetical protein